jgi:transcriptional regulator with XRE-family HTH domain
MRQASIQQIKAARALLDWNQGDLAKAAGLSLPSIAKVESGMTQPRSDTLQAIQSAFEQNGIEFLDSPGVQMRQESFKVDVMHGREGVLRLFGDIEITMANGGELLISSVAERYWITEYGDKFWSTLRRRRGLGVIPRLLIKEGDCDVIIGPEVYRSIPASIFSSSTPHYIYRNKMALVQIHPTVRVVLIESSAVAEAFRNLFEHNWKIGKVLPNQGLNIISMPSK